jgi:hypothetical protein
MAMIELCVAAPALETFVAVGWDRAIRRVQDLGEVFR